MKTGASVLLILFVVCSMHAQVVLERVNIPDTVRVLQVVAEREFYMLSPQSDRLYHSSGDFRTWRELEIPRIWEQEIPSYVLSAFADGEALLTFTEWNATRDTVMLGLLLWRDSLSRWTVDRCPRDERLPEGANGLVYAGDSIFFAKVPDGCLRSTDFGRTWTQVPALAGMKQPYFIGDGRGWAYQSSDTLSVIARTTDRGQTWSYDTLRVRLTALGVEYDGSVLAHIHDTIPSQSYYHFRVSEKEWKEISFPFVTDFDGRTAEWPYMRPLSQGRFLAVADLDNISSSRLFLSEDAGAHWTRLQNFRELPLSMWKPIDWRFRSLWRISPTEFLFRASSGESLATMALTLPSPLTASAENYSTTRRRQLLLRWSDPFGGDVRTVGIERSAADSSWLMLANSAIPEQEYLDSTWRSASPVRYRVTLHAADGRVAHAVTDSVTPILGAYVDYLDYLLPSVDKVLRYHAVDIRGRPYPGWDTTFTTVTLRFLTPWDSTALTRIHPVLKIVDSTNGKNDSTYGRIVEYRTRRHDFICDDVYPGLEFPTILPWASLFLEGPRHAGLMKQDLLAPMMWMLPDSLDIFTTESHAFGGWSCRYRMQEGIGVIDLSYRDDGFHDYKDYRFWTLIEHVNDADEPPLPASGIALASYPNPVTDGATVRYELPASSEVTLTVHDMLGRRVAVLAEGRRGAGTHHAVFRPAGLPSGTYLLRLLADGGAATRLISLIR